VTLGAVAILQTAFAQSELEPVEFEPVANDAAQAQVVGQIQEIRARDGIRSEGLIVPLTELAVLYEQTGLHALANAAIDQALQIIRVNRGVHSLDQALLLQQAIANDTTSGNLAAAWTREQELIELARRHPNDLRTVPIFQEVADGRMALFEAWMAGEYPEQMRIGGYCQSFGELFSCSRRGAARAVIGDAQMYYADAIEVLLRNELYSSDELRALETELVATSDLIRVRPELDSPPGIARPGADSRLNESRTLGVDEVERHSYGGSRRVDRDPIAARLGQLGPHGARDEPAADHDESDESFGTRFLSYYEFGRQSLVRLYDYEVASSAPLPDQARAFVELADWDLLYSRNSLAQSEYAQVYTWLEENGAAQETIEELFAPTIPVVLPAFERNPFVSEETEGASGYIDVAFRITKLGEPQRIEIVGASPGVTDAAKKDLEIFVKTGRFRPRVTDGEFTASSVAARYHVNDSQPVNESSAGPP
ncbi:MAG TPA: hypothetical protein VIC71_07800, partial [Gammaproteobacteria bacterium]